MLTDLDDLTIHQIPQTIDQVQGRNPRWADKLWFHVGTVDGQLSVAGHMGVYPSTRTMDAAAAVVTGGHVHSARFSRECKVDRDTKEVGAMSAEILEHFRSWRFVLAPSPESRISFDLTFKAERQPMEVAAPVFHRARGQHLTWHMWHYAQTGRAEGTITVDGTAIPLSEENTVAVRDRSWGVRPIFGQVPHLAPVPESIGRSSIWMAADLPDRSAWLWRIEPTDDQRAGLVGNLADQTGRTRLDGALAGDHGGAEPLRIIHTAPALDLDEAGRLSGGSTTITDEQGNSTKLDIRPLTTLYGKMLGYGHGEFRHNEWKGESLAQYEDIDLADSEAVSGLLANESGHINPFGLEHFCEFTAGGTTGHGVVRLSI